MLARLTRTAPAFWERPPGLLADVLLPIGAAWDGVGRLRRMLSRPYRPPVPVVCVGNLIVGGAGKTPVALALSAWLLQQGVRVHVVTRGYGGHLRGPIRVDPSRHDAVAVGDEALLLAATTPCWVARDRVDGARAAVAAGAQAIVLDDGFQNPAISKTLAVIVLDADYRFGNGRVVPAGPLRENLRGGLARADAVVLLGAEAGAVGLERPPAAIGLPVIHGALAPVAGERLAASHLFAFAGIGRPQKFFRALQELGAILVGTRAFPDHHLYRAAEISALGSDAQRLGARLITTRKDIVRLRPELRAGIDVLDVEMRWHDPSAVARLMTTAVLTGGGNGSDRAN